MLAVTLYWKDHRTGTGKTIALFSLITSYQLHSPSMGKLFYHTRTVPEMEKLLVELKSLIEYRTTWIASAIAATMKGEWQRSRPS